jgi:linoleoyl-CoA desaturase
MNTFFSVIKSTFAFNLNSENVKSKFPKLPISFHSELKKKIGEYFNQKGKRTTGNFNLHSKAILLVVGLITLYIHLVFFTPPAIFAIAECVILGCFAARLVSM